MSRKVGLVWDSQYLVHDAGDGHPERSERLSAIRKELQKKGTWERLVMVKAREATEQELGRAHSAHHIERVMDAKGQKVTIFDPDTHASIGTTEAALLAAGGGIELARKVWRGELERGFALVRPPGHHAEPDRIMGFCYFNNIAVAAQALLEDEGVERILILDWDVHHGNGTQAIFERDPRVLFCSTHQFPFYPGTGQLKDIGLDEGKGYTINITLDRGMGDDELAFAFEEIFFPIARQFKPQIILLSAGYDAHRMDFLGDLMVTTQGFAYVATKLSELADELCDGKLVAFLEGGYELDALAESVRVTLEAFLGDPLPFEVPVYDALPRIRDIKQMMAHTLRDFWSL